jgi:SAM-dependent methyltransferase
MERARVSIEEVRRYWDARPCNLRHSDAPVGSRRYWDEVEARKYAVEPHIPAFADFDGVWRGRWVLEIGCGLGTEAANFARAGAAVTAVDVSPESVRLARPRAEVLGIPRSGPGGSVDFCVADAEHLTEHIAGAFNLIWSFGVVHHSPHPERVLAEAYRLIATHGELRLMLYHRASTKVAALVLRHPLRALRGIDRAVAVQSEAQQGCPVTHTYTRRQARRLLASTGWEVTGMWVWHIFPYAIGPYRRHRLVRRWYWRPVPPRAFRWLEHRLGWHLLIIARPAERGAP